MHEYTLTFTQGELDVMRSMLALRIHAFDNEKFQRLFSVAEMYDTRKMYNKILWVKPNEEESKNDG